MRSKEKKLPTPEVTGSHPGLPPGTPPPEDWPSTPGIKTVRDEPRVIRWCRVLIYGRNPTHPRRIGSIIDIMRLSITDRSWMRRR
jgi:hypothetical protein